MEHRKSPIHGVIISIPLLLLFSCSSIDRNTDPPPVPGPESRFLSIDGYLIHYTDTGDPVNQDVLVLYHGFGGNLANFNEIIDELSTRYRVIAFDRPPFGYSQKLRARDMGEIDPYKPEYQARLGILLMDELGIRQAALIGHSAGGRAALQAAILYPGRVRGLVLISPAVYGGGGPPGFIRALFSVPPFRSLGVLLTRSLFRNSEALLTRSFHDSQHIRDDIRQQYLNGTEMPGWDQALWQFTLSSEEVDPGTLTNAFTADPADPAQSLSPENILIITGDDDRIVDPEDSLRLHFALRGSSFYVIPASGHIAFQESPEEFLSIALPWLEDRL